MRVAMIVAVGLFTTTGDLTAAERTDSDSTHGLRPTAEQGATGAGSSASNEVAENKRVLEEVIVTSQKRAERLQDVPVPVTSIDASELAAGNRFSLQDYYARIPGLSLTPSLLNGAPTVAIRGITSDDAANPTVAITVDDVPFGSSTSVGGGYFAPDLDPSDLARVEVLRGPQGTLYGASSFGGLIKFVTVDPSVEGVTGHIQAGLNSIRHSGSLGYNVNAGVNVPLNDSLALRVSGFSRKEPGYIDNVRGAGAQDVNQTEVRGGLLSGLWRPSDWFSLKLSALLQNSKELGYSYVMIEPEMGDFQQRFLPGTGTMDRKFQVFSAVANARFGTFDLTSVTGYSSNRVADLLDYELPGFDYALQTDDAKTYKFNQEFRLSTPIGSHLDWLLGGFYTREYSPSPSSIFVSDPEGQPVGEVWQSTQLFSTYTEWAAFTDLTYRVTDRFDVQFGGRSIRLKQSRGETNSGAYAGEDVPPVVTPEIFVHEDAFTYLVTPRFRLSSDLMLYARLASGYRAGGMNRDLLPGLPQLAKPDTTQNYEIGVKGTAFARRVSFDASLYYIDWKDIQLLIGVPDFDAAVFVNGSRAKSEGVELSAQWLPVRGLQLGGWVAQNNAVLTEAMPPESASYGPAGSRLPFGSRLSANGSVDYEFPLASVTAAIGGAVSYVGERVGAFKADDTPRERFPAYTQTDLHAGVRWDAWTVDLYINNVTDKRGVIGGGDGNLRPTAFVLIPPRTAGLSVARTFP